MNAIILAAGRGERMRPLTDSMPKALLEVAGKPLIVRHIEKLAAAGSRRVVINHAHLGRQIEASVGSGARFGIDIVYSPERQALETAGGIANALPFLGLEPFAAVNADVYSDYDYSKLAPVALAISKSRDLAHLILVDNPEHHPLGDFALRGASLALAGPRLTFSGIAVYRPELFADVVPGVSTKLAPLLREKIGSSQVKGEHYRGTWFDIGTPQRLARLNAVLGYR